MSSAGKRRRALNEIVPDDPSRAFEASSAEDLPLNQAIVTYKPVLTPGIYYFKVTAHDKNNNQSGPLAYEVQFEVRDANRFSKIKVFPNPARTYVVFDFFISGMAPPDELHFDIYGVNGTFITDLAGTSDKLKFIGEHRIIWDTSALPAGTYFYKISGKLADGTNFTGDDSLKGKITIVN